MLSLKKIAEEPNTKGTIKDIVIRYISTLFIKSEKRAIYLIINSKDWGFLKTLPGITEYLMFERDKGTYENGQIGYIWGAVIFLINETGYVKVYSDINDIKAEFPTNKTIARYNKYGKLSSPDSQKGIK